ncbi:aldehyde dehydrogenase (NADP(+)) [Microbacterium sp. zg.Y909]|uniref:aldehyde dehydrogenase (NADP(+)) n=1 Tax=Microbacterium sp. zg.Y909 TaxID=2969413 RepID=UPI00214B40A6|nr:aldehyde dehydrogenase (NADP(+)) [Microbacterium sp. zg.Y909]MCR2825743.1 aldehyde dehydrogenase (NADP(+)) [Microbacterium sp. zg.Y909]
MSAETTVEQVGAHAAAAHDVFPAYAAAPAAARAGLLESIAAGMESRSEALVEIAAAETHMPPQRLAGEVVRTAYQLRAFAHLVRSGRHLHAVVEHTDPDYPVGGPAPDLRSINRPVGPVAVFAASNFPFAFSVAGGDTASALAVGCPTIVKAHPGHLRLSEATAEIVHEAVRSDGFAPAVFSMVHGEQAGIRLLQHPAIRAAAFTGSTVGGRALFDVAARRPDPIPFFGEQGSLNPVFVTVEAARAHVEDLATAFVASYTLGNGQLCTKPGLVFVPQGSGFAERAAAAVDGVGPARLLNERIRSGYEAVGETFTEVAGIDVLRTGSADLDEVRPALFRASMQTFLAHSEALAEERFGPSALVVEYDDPSDLLRAARAVGGTLTATVQASSSMDGGIRELVDELALHAGRLVYDGWPTGVIVSPAMVHGGPYPATTSPGFTSVGARAVERFLRPIAYQGFPDDMLPDALSEHRAGDVPREVDLGRLLR